VLAGFSGHGFKHAAGIGEIAAQLTTEGGTAYDLHPFRADRIAEPPDPGFVTRRPARTSPGHAGA
jgi:glycine/D-amino acid oxidase-like deaminating enzyme